MSDNDETKPRYKATRDLELVGDARLVPGGIEINGTIVDPNGHRVWVSGTLTIVPDPPDREWVTKEDVRVREVRHNVTTPRESFVPVLLVPPELATPRLPQIEHHGANPSWPPSQLERYGDNFIPPGGVHDGTCAFVCEAVANCAAEHSCRPCDAKARKEGRIK